MLNDSAPDQAANPDNTFSYTLNLSDCLPDGEGMLLFDATFAEGDRGSFSFYVFERQP